MSEAQVSAEDAQLFKNIAVYIAQHPPLFREAGAWLDTRFYNEKAFARHKAQAIRSDRKLNLAVTGRASDTPKGLRREKQARSERLPLHERFTAAIQHYLNLNVKNRLHHLLVEDAAQILLITWLLTDADADKVRVGVTSFEAWHWELPNELSEGPKRYGRRFSCENAFHWWDDGQSYARWLELVKKAWISRPGSKCENMPKSTQPESEHPPQPTEDDTQPSPPPLTQNDRLTLAALATFNPSLLVSAADITKAMPAATSCSERTTYSAINRLIKMALAERPEGKKQGARLTIKGRRLASKVAD